MSICSYRFQINEDDKEFQAVYQNGRLIVQDDSLNDALNGNVNEDKDENSEEDENDDEAETDDNDEGK